MFMNLGPLAKVQHGVKRHSPQAIGHSQKADMSSSLNTVLRRLQLGSQETLSWGPEAHP